MFFHFRVKLLSVHEFNSNSMVWLPSIFATYCDAVTGPLIFAFQSKLVAIFPCSNGTNRRKIVAFFMNKQKIQKLNIRILEWNKFCKLPHFNSNSPFFFFRKTRIFSVFGLKSKYYQKIRNRNSSKRFYVDWFEIFRLFFEEISIS